MANGNSSDYEVLSPWAEVDVVPPKGIAPRLPDLTGKVIGLFGNGKRASPVVLSLVQQKLEKKFPELKFSWYQPAKIQRFTELQAAGDNKAVFEDWVSNIDAAVAAVGD